MPSPDDTAEVQLFADGACSGNPGPGGWAFILRHVATEKEKEAFGGERQTTNNRMELTAVIRGLEALKRPTAVELITDSVYVGKGISEWLPKWKANGLAAARKRPLGRGQERRPLAAAGRIAAAASPPLHARPRPQRPRRERTLRRLGRSGISEVLAELIAHHRPCPDRPPPSGAAARAGSRARLFHPLQE